MYIKAFTLTILILIISTKALATADPAPSDENPVFDDTQLEEELVYPDWFKLSLGDLGDDLDEAKQAGKQGIITYFGQKRCAYCEQFFNTSLADTDIKNYLQKHYDIRMRSSASLTDRD